MSSDIITPDSVKIESPISLDSLTRFNRIMSIVHAVQGVLMIFLGTVLDYPFDLYTFYKKYTDLGGGDFNITVNPAIAFTFTALGAAVGSFLLMSALAHFILGWPANKWYRRNMEREYNPLRWWEYAFSSSVMIVLIGMFFGISDVWTLFAMFMSNFLMNMFGLVMEKLNLGRERKDVDWSPYLLGVVAGLVQWVIIVGYFVGTGATPPDFVYAIFIVEFLLFNSFAWVMVAYYKGWGKFKDFRFGEATYQVLSVVAKTLLAWLVFGGVFQPS